MSLLAGLAEHLPSTGISRPYKIDQMLSPRSQKPVNNTPSSSAILTITIIFDQTWP